MKLPTLFIGHGSPMNAIAKNGYTQWLNRLGRELPRPTAILIISAHWVSEGTHVLNLQKPPTIHDFRGFPPELYQIRYPAEGLTELTVQIQQLLGSDVKPVTDWGYDHGVWSVLRHLYPQADIPVVSLSLNQRFSFSEHYVLAQRLRPLRAAGVLLLGSGNIVHNLQRADLRDNAPVMPWAVEADRYFAQAIQSRDPRQFAEFEGAEPNLIRMAIPTPEHYAPLLYVLGAAEADEALSFPFDEIQNGSLAMRSVRFG